MHSVESNAWNQEVDFEKFTEKERKLADGEMQARLAIQMFGKDGKSVDEIMLTHWTTNSPGANDSMSKKYRDMLVEHPQADFIKRFMIHAEGPFTGPAVKERITNNTPCTFEQQQVLDELEELLRDHVPQSPS